MESLKKGDYAIDISTGFPLIVQDNKKKSYRRYCEVFGNFHESGGVLSRNLKPISKEEFERLKKSFGSPN